MLHSTFVFSTSNYCLRYFCHIYFNLLLKNTQIVISIWLSWVPGMNTVEFILCLLEFCSIWKQSVRQSKTFRTEVKEPPITDSLYDYEIKKKKNSVALVGKRTISTTRLPLVGEVLVQTFAFFLFGFWGYWHCGHSWPIVPASDDNEDDCGEADGM
jgi:hypothetical protein